MVDHHRVATTVKLGPYVAGEIPPAFTYTFLDDEDTPVPLDGFDAKLVWKRRTEVTEVDADIAPDQTTNPGEVTYVWQEGDLDEAGAYKADLWVGDGINRFASVRLVWEVARAVAPHPDV